MKRISVLGSTGSIGTQTLDIIDRHRDRFQVVGLTANNNWHLLAQQTKRFLPERIAIRNAEHLKKIQRELRGYPVEILYGEEGILEVASTPVNMVVVALVGISGLLPTLKAIDVGNNIALANKETLVVGGEIVTQRAKEKGVAIIPIDSEHSAIFQCLQGEDRGFLKKIYLTSSGGAFRDVPSEKLPYCKPSDALKHPTWSMGKKVTIDSATLMNKGLEVIEARWLFDVDPENIQVLIHPQSVIHSMVEFIDGSIKAQLSLPDMRIPIQYALSSPERLKASFVETDFIKIGKLTFQEPRYEDFPCLRYAFRAISIGGTMPAVLNGANEVAVELFLIGAIGFMDIPNTVNKVMNNHDVIKNPTIEDLIQADKYARRTAYEVNRTQP